MATVILSDIPEKITAGDSIAWKKTLADYPANDGWVLSYALTKTGEQITFNASADGADHLVELDTTDTTAWAAGQYSFQAYATKAATTERKTVDQGIIEIIANLAAEAGGLDARPHCFIMRDALQALSEGKATTDQLSLSINNRSISMLSPSEVREWLATYETLCVNHMRQLRADRGKPTGQQVKARFVGS
jgi:hypothetical protein